MCVYVGLCLFMLVYVCSCLYIMCVFCCLCICVYGCLCLLFSLILLVDRTYQLSTPRFLARVNLCLLSQENAAVECQCKASPDGRGISKRKKTNGLVMFWLLFVWLLCLLSCFGCLSLLLCLLL